MAIYNFRNASVVYNAVDLSNHVKHVRVAMSADDLDGTGMGALSHTHVPGLRDDRFEITFMQDHAAGSVDLTLRAQIGVAAGVVVAVKADATTGPTYTMTAVLLDYEPLNGDVGTISQTTVTLVPAAGSAGIVVS